MNENEKNILSSDEEQIETPAEETVEAAAVEADGAENAEETEAAADAAEESDAAADAEAEEEPEKKKDAKQDKKAKKCSGFSLKKMLRSRKFRFGAASTALTVIVSVLLVLVSVIGDLLNDRFPLNMDLTADKSYTFSENSEKVAKLVDRDVEIVVFSAEDTFKNATTGDEGTILKQFYEFTKKYESLTGGKVKTVYIDATNDPTSYAKYSDKYDLSAGGNLPILFRTDDRYRVVGPTELYETTGDGYYQQQISSSNVESVLATNLQYLCRNSVEKVTMITGHDEGMISGRDSGTVADVTDVLKRNGYDVETVDFTTSNKISDDSRALVIVAPSKDYSADDIKRIRTWLYNDGSYGRDLVVLTDYTASCPNLYDFLKEEYYVQVESKVVLETSADYTYNFYAYYPYANIETTDFTSAVAGKKVLLPTCLQLTPLKENNTDYAQYVVPLAKFNETAQLMPITSLSDKNAKAVEPEGDVYGVLLSVYDSYNNDLQEQTTTRVLISGSYDILNSDIRQSLSTVKNEDMFMGAFNQMMGNTDSIVVSSHSINNKTLEYSGTAKMVLGFGVFTVAVPLIMIILCLVVFIRRKHL